MKINDSAATQLVPESAPNPEEPPKYVLQHSEQELRRLETQGSFLRAATHDFLQRTGVAKGMRVLDIGCGVGDVSFLAAEMVGPSGEVVGVDRAEPAISTALMRARAKGLANVRFLQCDINEMGGLAAEGLFDAVICRLVIIHQKKPVETIKNVLRRVRPGGVVGFQEIDLDARYWSTRRMETLEQLYDCLDQVTARNGMAVNLSAAFVEAFDEAGVVQRRIIRSGAVESASEMGVYEWLGSFTKTLTKAVAAMGLQPPDFGDFAKRLKDEAASTGAVFIPVHFIGAAGHLPHLRVAGS